MSQREDPFEAPEVRAMRVDGEPDEASIRSEDIEPEGTDSDGIESDGIESEDIESDGIESDGIESEDIDADDMDVEAGRATQEDMALAEAELVDQGEIPASDREFD